MLDKGFNGEFFEQVCKSTDFKNSHSMPTDDRLPPGRRGDLLLRTLANKAIKKSVGNFEFKNFLAKV